MVPRPSAPVDSSLSQIFEMSWNLWDFPRGLGHHLVLPDIDGSPILFAIWSFIKEFQDTSSNSPEYLDIY